MITESYTPAKHALSKVMLIFKEIMELALNVVWILVKKQRGEGAQSLPAGGIFFSFFC